MSRYLIVVIVAIVAYASQINSQATQPTYTVKWAYDGDTLTAADSANREVRVRLICVDAPEKAQPTWGLASRDNLRKLLPVGARFTIRNQKIDMYGRTLGLVYDSNNVNLNEVQVTSGFATAYRKEPGCESFVTLESQAKAKRLNIWSDPKFVLPDEWRRLNPN